MLLILVQLVGTPTALADPAAGRAVFLRQECDACHSVKSDGIEVVVSDEEDDSFDFDDDLVEEDEERPPPDLSGLANRRDRNWMDKWLQKKIKNDDGNKHEKKFEGSSEELTRILDYLATLKVQAVPRASKP